MSTVARNNGSAATTAEALLSLNPVHPASARADSASYKEITGCFDPLLEDSFGVKR
ncbi:MAG: hypothetical protein ACE5JL_11805 [Dehalococcoidia bacterium]